MNSWSKRRKIVYALVVVIILVGAVGVPVFMVFYKAPTCSDGIKNGSEKGIDCGGSCQKLCADSFMAPQVSWTRMEKIGPGLYNVAAYIINPNKKGEAKDVPYRIVMYDKDGVPIIDTVGKVTIPPNRNTLAFKSAINTKESVPLSRVFEFTGAPDWVVREDTLAALTYDSGSYTEDGSSSSFTVDIKNNDVRTIKNVSVYVVLKDKDQNVIGFSKTLIDEIPAKGSVVAPFTWPISRNGAVISQEVLPVAE